jgi:hypothetical protein
LFLENKIKQVLYRHDTKTTETTSYFENIVVATGGETWNFQYNPAKKEVNAFNGKSQNLIDG